MARSPEEIKARRAEYDRKRYQARKEEFREANRKRYKENAEKQREGARLRREKNREELNRKRREYWAKNKKVLNAKRREQRRKDIEAMLFQERQYREKNRESINFKYRLRYKVRKNPIDTQAFRDLVDSRLKECDRLKVKALHLPCGDREECFHPRCPFNTKESPPDRRALLF